MLQTLFCLFCCLLVSCSRAPTEADKQGQPADQKAGQPSGPPPVPVTVRAVVQKTVPVQLEAVGTVQAYAQVSVEARVDGLVVARHFEDGQYVQTGAPLFTLDTAPYEAQLKQ